jgi:hypothetical protein
MTSKEEIHSNAQSHVNRIPGVTLDDGGFIHTAYGSYHPVTGEGHTFDMPKEMEFENALIEDGLDSGLATDFDLDKLLEEIRCEFKD